MSTTTATTTHNKPVLTTHSINPNILNVEYAVRGELSNRANKYAAQLQQLHHQQQQSSSSSSTSTTPKLKFESVVTANIGNPQQQPYLAQKPLTFWRQVAALTELPSLMENEAVLKSGAFPPDAIQRARDILADVGSVGAYSHSKGAASIRKHVAEFIQARDGGHASDPELIYLTTGASGGVQLLLSVLINSPQAGVAIPIPQYPLYSAALSLYNAHAVRYDLNASDDWSLNVQQLRENITTAREKDGIDVRALVVINPGNPTGSCLTEENIRDIIQLAYDLRLVVMADEVYQANIYTHDRPFVSFKKVLRDFATKPGATEQDKKIAQEVELVSFHSISKGFTGECGRRGGYFELVNIDPEVEAQVYKMASVNLCPSIQGQIGVDLLVKPPAKGDASYDLYQQESSQILETLKARSMKMQKKFNSLPGVVCNEAQGALYLFPQVTLPPKAHEAAKKASRKPDEFYCLAMLDETGICVVPGSGFGMAPREDGSIFFRTTILAKETDAFVERYEKFHKQFLEQYA